MEETRIVFGIIFFAYMIIVLRINTKRGLKIKELAVNKDTEEAVRLARKFGFWLGTLWPTLIGTLFFFGEIKPLANKVKGLEGEKEIVKSAKRGRILGAVTVFPVLVIIALFFQLISNNQSRTVQVDDAQSSPSNSLRAGIESGNTHLLYDYQDDMASMKIPCESPKIENENEGRIYKCPDEGSEVYILNAYPEMYVDESRALGGIGGVKEVLENNISKAGGSARWEKISNLEHSVIITDKTGEEMYYGYVAVEAGLGLKGKVTYSQSRDIAKKIFENIVIK